MRTEILNASAGSGKTYRLAYNYVRDVVWKPMLYRHILAVTFTNKATEEMKSRILKEINLLASGQKSDYLPALEQELQLDQAEIQRRAYEARSAILHDYSRFTVLTIDKFFQRILHAFVKELGIELNYEIELESAPVLGRGVDALIERIAQDKELFQWIEAFARERNDEQQGWNLRSVILKLGQELFREGLRDILNAAHDRKSLSELLEQEEQKMRDLKGEMARIAEQATQLIESYGYSVDDFSQKKSGGAAYFYRILQGEISQPNSYVRKCAEGPEDWVRKGNPGKIPTTLLEALHGWIQQILTIYDEHIRQWNSISLIRKHYRTYALLKDLYHEVQQLWNDENRLLLSETKNILAAFIDQESAPFIYEKVGNRYDRYLIDEFQDTSKREWLNFLPLLQDALSHPTQLSLPEEQEVGSSVLLVGDTKQSIYRWRGGDWRILGIDAPQALQVEQVESMTNNFRSLELVVRFNNLIIERVVRQGVALLRSKLQRVECPELLQEELCQNLTHAYTQHAQTARKKGEHSGYISIEQCKQEANIVPRILEILDAGYRPCDILVLVRKANEGVSIAQQLLNFKSQNQDPRYHFDIMTQDALNLKASPLCNFIIALLNLAIDPKDRVQQAIFNRYRGYPLHQKIDNRELEWLRALRLRPTEEAFEAIVMRYQLNQSTRELAYLQALHEQVIHFSSSHISDIPLFLEWWEEHGEKCYLQVGDSETTLEISTIHSAKGLERKVIIIPYCNWDLEPRTRGAQDTIVWVQPDDEQNPLQALGPLPMRFEAAMTQAHYSKAYCQEMANSYIDNINLLYVALTRAAEQLHIFLPEKSTVGVHKLINEVLTAQEGDFTLQGEQDQLCAEVTSTEQGTRFEFGTFQGPERPKSSHAEQRVVTQHRLEHYPTTPPSPQLRLPHDDYRERGGEIEFSPRDFGVQMHRLFQEAATRQELHEALARMEQEALLNKQEAEALARRVEKALEEPVVASWYDTPWERVLSERDIIHPATSSEGNRRPDRVMLQGKRAVVVDYKFGEKRPGYAAQMRRYMALMQQMGYTEVEGWIWYVRLGVCEQVFFEKK